MKEYDQIFDGEEKLLHLMKLPSDAYTKKIITIEIDKIGIPEAMKKGRADTKIGLTTSIKELGVVVPIIVMTTEEQEDDDEYYDETIKRYDYTLVHGLRRLFGARKNNIKVIEAIVLDFQNKDLGRNVALVLGLAMSKVRKRTWSEIWDLLQILELQSNFEITPGTVENLLDLEPGDYMKIKDVMLSDDEEARAELLSNKKSLEQCYRLLMKHRKEEDDLAKEDSRGLSEVAAVAEIVNKEESPLLSDKEVSQLLEIGETTDSESLSLAELDKTSDIRGIEHQKSGERHIIDPIIKDRTLRRDNFRCRCCDTGGEAWLGVLVYHHTVPVSAGGPDTVENGLTLCANCHLTLHIYVEGDLVLANYDTLPEAEKKTLKNIMKYGNIAINAYKIRNMNKAQIKAADSGSKRHLMPGEGLKGNTIAFKKYQTQTASGV